MASTTPLIMDRRLRNGSLDVFNASYHHAVELIGRRWTGVIIRALMAGAKHFSELTASIPGLSDRLVSVRLKELENEGIVERIVIPDKPVRIEYVLTTKGRALEPIISAIDGWASEWEEPIAN